MTQGSGRRQLRTCSSQGRAGNESLRLAQADPGRQRSFAPSWAEPHFQSPAALRALRSYSHCLRLLEPPDLLDVVHEVPAVDVLHDEVEPVLGAEERAVSGLPRGRRPRSSPRSAFSLGKLGPRRTSARRSPSQFSPRKKELVKSPVCEDLRTWP